MANIINSGFVRKVVYGVYAVLSLSTGALHVWFGALKVSDPEWLTGATAVIAFLASAPLTLALVNVFAPVTDTSAVPDLPAQPTPPAS